MGIANERLGNQSAVKSFFQYFIPTLFGMMLMSVNIVIDGIFVGNGVGAVALASVNVAVPVFSIMISIALLIGTGGGTLYSMAMGEGNRRKAQSIFTVSFILVMAVTLVASAASYLNMEQLAYFFGANEDTIQYVLDYMAILFLFSLVIALETFLSIFVRNDGNPRLAMFGLVTAAVLNVILNYWFIFILKWEVAGAALATVLATAAGLLVLLTHFFKKGSGLRFVPFQWNRKQAKDIFFIGLPSFLSEAGLGIFVIAYNIAIARYAGTNGLAAFSVINYLHTFMLLAFMGIGAAIQPMISYYYGAKKHAMIKATVRVAERTGLGLGLLFIAIGYVGTDFLVAIFGVASEDIHSLAANGIQLFFLGYLFMGINFIYMTYYQSIGQVKPSIGITIFRGFILLIIMLLILPPWLGTAGVWLALPAAEGIVAAVLLVWARKGIMGKRVQSHGF